MSEFQKGYRIVADDEVATHNLVSDGTCTSHDASLAKTSVFSATRCLQSDRIAVVARNRVPHAQAL